MMQTQNTPDREFAIRRLVTLRAQKAQLSSDIARRAQTVAVRLLRAGDSAHRAAEAALGPYVSRHRQGGAQ
ncbi:hypothetical protein [Thioalkalivibrio sp. ALgr3]|uniref:hypothetical protein n=1 Tax=Thioalkalivibrio sp. ALgr3 TaxID=1239292 RepID=UPI00036D644E|nr:hypothetical protein [Thioalkalivibrio sp. ALgr3]